MVKNVAIVGGGISGLYAAHLLLKRYKDMHVTVYEAGSYWGGRVVTLNHDGESFDIGAARFNKRHKLLWELLKEFGLEKDIYKLSHDKVFLKDGKVVNVPTLKYINMAIERSKNETPRHLKSITFEMYMKGILPDSVVDDVMMSFGYGLEFQNMNAYEAIRLFKGDFVGDVDYYILKGGLSRLIYALIDSLRVRRCGLYLNAPVVGCVSDGRGLLFRGSNVPLYFDHVFYCVTKSALMGIHGLVAGDGALLRSLGTLGGGELYRVFAKFPLDSKGRPWFHGITKTTSNSMLRTIIPLNFKTGLIMISYTDGEAARKWVNIDRDTRIREMLVQLRKLFKKIEIPEPIWVNDYFWEEGIHYWKPGEITYKNDGDNYSVCGEVVGGHGWIEGGLVSVAGEINRLRSDRYAIV